MHGIYPFCASGLNLMLKTTLYFKVVRAKYLLHHLSMRLSRSVSFASLIKSPKCNSLVTGLIMELRQVKVVKGLPEGRAISIICGTSQRG